MLRWSFFVTFAAMDENEYIDYYCKHLLVTKMINEKMGFYDNDISTTNFDQALFNANKCGIDKTNFSKSLKYVLTKHKRNINIDALWKFSLAVWMWKRFSLVVMPEMGAVDQYLRLINNINQGLDLKEIVFIGRLPNKTKDINISLTDNILIGKFFDFLYSQELAKHVLTEQNINSYPQTNYHFVGDLIPKRTLAYQIARELTLLFEHYYHTETLDESLKDIIMRVLSFFNLAAKTANNTDYNKLFSDAKTGRLQIFDFYYDVGYLNGLGVLPFSIIKNPDSVKERKTYGESAEE